MTANSANMSGLSRGLDGGEGWEDLVAWENELYDPIFHGDTTFTGAPANGTANDSFGSSYRAESIASEQPYEPSAPPSIVDGPSAFDYIVSAPPSIIDGPSSFGQTYSLLSTSPSFSTTATSPIVGRDDQAYNGSYNDCEHFFSPIEPATQSPVLDVLDTRVDRLPQSASSSGSFQTTSSRIFNPFMVGSPHAFSRRDVSASEAFANVGTWADQPQIIEPIPELDHTGAIPIPQPPHQSFSNTFSSHPWSGELPQQQARAITIPQARRPTASHPNLQPQHWSQHVPPILSISPESRRRTRSVALSRSSSRSEPRRNKNSLTTPSPTSNTFGWVSYQPNAQTNRLVPSGTDGNKGRRQRGRTRALTAEQRRGAALMRLIKACSNCKRRKEKCDAGTPCKSCLDHYKGDLINNPCRERLLSDLTKTFLSERLGWHPTTRSIPSFVGPNPFSISTGITYNIPLIFGFGSPLHVVVNAVEVLNTPMLRHDHIIYSWPPSTSEGDRHRNAVLPAVLTHETISNLSEILDIHLSLLVNQHFAAFPLFCSPLRILREVYVFYRNLPTKSPHSRLLHQALKLLVLVHIGGDLVLPPPSSDPVLAQLVRTSMAIPENTPPTPCFIRAQFGAVMPSLALKLMHSILSSLEQLFLSRSCTDWPVALAVLVTVLMTIESIQYHAAKLPYHHSCDAESGVDVAELHAGIEEERRIDDEGVKSLLAFYSTCFGGCHARLRPEWEGEAGEEGPEERFVESVRGAVRRARSEGYLEKKAEAERVDGGMGFFFDRLVAGLLVLR
ncbi:hypothetical protein BS50DRAFT_626036 [Corynespora cassiicola Philippines]|uniref:Zn(2)-C6 fungal-type domain-containing protein n=1 Tax=Corynespora cassiicola Philippines TaxID=1448308 RepID=A0A2T2N4H6_CORCC|nr:hypothetical protein BS50DRAFT_626036 [Corynespora cassiicola Philippines]